jgi:hypothetical protein
VQAFGQLYFFNKLLQSLSQTSPSFWECKGKQAFVNSKLFSKLFFNFSRGKRHIPSFWECKGKQATPIRKQHTPFFLPKNPKLLTVKKKIVEHRPKTPT